jgi:hypothetical protein
MAIDCKSIVETLRWFKSNIIHNEIFKTYKIKQEKENVNIMEGGLFAI